MSRVVVFTLLMTLIFNIGKSQNQKAFYIGHSLTDYIPEMVKSLSDAHSLVSMDWRFQSIPGAPLRWQWERQYPGNGYNPNPPHMYGFFHPTQGLPAGDFDALVLTESVPRHWTAWGIFETYRYADSFYMYFNNYNPDKQLFLYEVWHCINSGTPTGCDYDIDSNPWRQRLSDDYPMWKSVLDTINTRHSPSPPMRLIPGGQGLAMLYDSIQANVIPGITSISQLFADDIHLNDVGRYFIACVHFATLHKISPVGLPNQLYSQWGNPFTPPTVAQAAKFQQIAWKVVTDYWQVTGVNPPPVQAGIQATPTTGVAPLSVSFDGSSSVNNGGGSLTYQWNFADGSPLGSGQMINHTFQNPGQYVVTLTVSDASSNTDTETVTINVSNPNSAGVCAYLAYDGFEYNQNSPLHGQSGGEGFSGNWLVQGDNTDVPGFQTSANNNSLSYLDLQVSGIHISGGRNYLASGRRLNTSLSGPFADYILPSNQTIGAVADGSELWMSVLINKPQNDNDEVYLEMHSADLAWCNLCPSTQRIGVGYYGTSSNVGGQRRWSLSIGNTVYPSSVPMVAGTTALLVLRLTFNASGTQADLFVNPTLLGDNDPGTPQLTQTTPTPYTFRSITFYGGSQAGKGFIDEWRMAESYKCAVPDPNISYLLPPTAIISATPTVGMAPLLVNFNGSSSLNPAGGSLTYSWDFGDGSPLSNLVSPSHSYPIGGGQVTATLTVTDINNNSHSASRVITLLDENGSFSCLSSVTAVRQADCSGTGGHLQIHTNGNPSVTLSLNSVNISPSSGNNYTNLVAGIYQLQISGSNGCSDQYMLHVPIDSSTCVGWQPSSCAMEIGTNLPGFADWEPHRAMRNFMKNTRGEAIPYTTACNCWSFDENTNNDIFSQMAFDADGYPTYLPQTTTHGNILLRYFVSSEGRNMPPGQTYVLLYDGVGVFEISGMLSGVSQTSGRIQFTLGGDGTFWFQLTQSTLGNHVRNIRIVRLADEFADLVNQPFYQEFVDKITPFSVIRYMDWQHTNNNPMVNWNERTLPGRFSYGNLQGVPYELIIQLANQTQKDVWICVPHAANNDFITQMATLFRDQLDPNITIYLEYSNEVWNWIFAQAGYNNNTRPFNLNYGRAMALKAKNTFDIWHSVFIGQECRVKRVLGIQGGFNYLNEQILAHLHQDDWDYGSPTHYFGLDHDESGVPRLDLLGATATVAQVMQNAQNNFNGFKNLVKQDYRNVQVYGKEVITYEGGQHFVGNVFGSPYPYQQAMWDAQNSQLMYEMYDMLHDSIRTWGCKLATNFSLAGPQESVYGSWGVMEHIDIQPPYITTAPKYQALLDNMPDQTCHQTHTWLGQVNSDWSEICNWSKNRLPDENAVVVVPNDVPNYPQVDINSQVRMVRLATNAFLTVLTGFQLTVLGE